MVGLFEEVNRMAKVISLQSKAKQILAKKWPEIANEFHKEARVHACGSPTEVGGELLKISLAKLSVGNVELQTDSYVMFVRGVIVKAEKYEIVNGWLCFDDEINAIHYLRFVWLGFVEANIKNEDKVSKETYSLVKKAMGICMREGGFKNKALKAIVIEGINALANIMIDNPSYITDEDFDVELTGHGLAPEDDGEIANLVLDCKLNVRKPEHLRLLEAWMSRLQ